MPKTTLFIFQYIDPKDGNQKKMVAATERCIADWHAKKGGWKQYEGLAMDISYIQDDVSLKAMGVHIIAREELPF